MSSLIGLLTRTAVPFLFAVCIVLQPSLSTAQERYTLEFGGPGKASELSLSIGKSQIINSPTDLDQVVIGNPDTADIKLLSSRQVLILGKKPGRTNLVIRDKGRNLVAVLDVVVGYDQDGIKRKLFEALPNEKGIQVRGQNDSVMLSGDVSSVLAMDTALAIARSYVPEKKVVNMMQVAGSQQVMLEVKVSEVNRSAIRQLGVGTTFSNTDSAGRAYSIITGTPLSRTPFGSGTFTNPATGVLDLMELRLQALETRGLAKVLAEPNLVALSGQEASFLAGGEFPVVVLDSVGDNYARATVEYKPFGVGLKFVPTVLGSDKINLKLNTEVSEVDESRSVSVIGGQAYPSLATRRAGTTVEVGDGQSFAIAGLITNNMKNTLAQLPGLGDIPILGALFRSTEFSRDETELVIVVTPRLVRPVAGSDLALPTDTVVPPSALGQYLMGRLEGYPPKQQKAPDAPKTETAPSQPQGGIEGNFGHEL